MTLIGSLTEKMQEEQENGTVNEVLFEKTLGDKGVKPENVATFLGKKLHGNYQDEVGNNFNTRIEGTRIKHAMGPASIKMYDKFGLIFRIETTVNDVSFFKTLPTGRTP